MRVLFVNSTDGYGGGEFYARDFAQGLELDGSTTATFIMGEKTELLDNLVDHGLHAQTSRAALKLSRPLAVLRNVLALRRYSREFAPDVVVCNLPRATVIAALALPRRVRRIALLHSPIGSDRISRLASRFVHEIVTNTERNAESLRGSFPGIPVRALGPIARTSKMPEYRSVRKDVSMIGRFQEYKGHLDFVEMASLLRSRGVEANFHILGSASDDPQRLYLERVRAAVVSAGLSDGVQLHVNVSDAELQETLQQTAVYAHVAKFEDFGISLVEALSSGCAVVAYEADGPKLILQDSPSGRLIPIGDVQALASGVEELLSSMDDDSTAASLSEDSYRTASRHSFGTEYARACSAALMPPDPLVRT